MVLVKVIVLPALLTVVQFALVPIRPNPAYNTFGHYLFDTYLPSAGQAVVLLLLLMPCWDSAVLQTCGSLSFLLASVTRHCCPCVRRVSQQVAPPTARGFSALSCLLSQGHGQRSRKTRGTHCGTLGRESKPDHPTILVGKPPNKFIAHNIRLGPCRDKRCGIALQVPGSAAATPCTPASRAGSWSLPASGKRKLQFLPDTGPRHARHGNRLWQSETRALLSF